MTMISVQRLCFAAVCAASASFGAYASLENMPLREIDGRMCRVYEVQPRETVYSLTRKLGITADELYAANPQARDGLKAYMVLAFPVTADSSGASPRQVHHVGRGETVYGISNRYGITHEQLVEWNPEVADGLRAGQSLYVSAPSAVPTNPNPESASGAASLASSQPGYIEYTVGKKETFYSIARTHGVSIHELEAANPGVGILQAGSTILIPVASSTGAGEIASEQPGSVFVSGLEVDSVSAPELRNDRSIDIALALPLMASSNPRPRHADVYLDFYKGFLIAVDSMRHCGTPINLSVYDTKSSADTLAAILSSPDFKRPDVIVGPDNEEQLRLVEAYAQANDVYVFNPFVVRDEGFVDSPVMMQANIPQTMMYDKAIDGMLSRYGSFLPVVVAPEGGADDKRAFVGRMRERFNSAGIEMLELKCGSSLSVNDLAALPTGRPLMLVPVSGRQAELNKILPAAVELQAGGRQVMVFGYPEWTMFRGETLDNMHKVDAVVYSRFFTADDTPDAERLDGRFVYWFGQPMQNVLPLQGLLGFDSGMYLIEAVRQTGGRLSEPVQSPGGIQNGFHFVRPEGARGLVNDMLYMINYRPDGTVDKIEL